MFYFWPIISHETEDYRVYLGFCCDNCCSFWCCGVATYLVEKSFGASCERRWCMLMLQLVGCCSFVVWNQRVIMRAKYGIYGMALLKIHFKPEIGKETVSLKQVSVSKNEPKIKIFRNYSKSNNQETAFHNSDSNQWIKKHFLHQLFSIMNQELVYSLFLCQSLFQMHIIPIGDPCEDLLISCVCCPCALGQMVFEIDEDIKVHGRENFVDYLKFKICECLCERFCNRLLSR